MLPVTSNRSKKSTTFFLVVITLHLFFLSSSAVPKEIGRVEEDDFELLDGALSVSGLGLYSMLLEPLVTLTTGRMKHPLYPDLPLASIALRKRSFINGAVSLWHKLEAGDIGLQGEFDRVRNKSGRRGKNNSGNTLNQEQIIFAFLGVAF